MRNAHDGMVTHLCNVVTVCHDMKTEGGFIWGGGEGEVDDDFFYTALVTFTAQTVLANVAD
jgi:hypothetical protein